MSAYVIIEIKVLNQTVYDEYINKVPSIVKKYGGHYLARGGQIIPLSGDWHPERVILLEFDSFEQIQKWLASPEYAEIAPLRMQSTIGRAIVIESGSTP
jgi:uncharacterized protein (DUF1330 family)